MTRARKLSIAVGVLTILAAVFAYVVTLANPGWRLSRAYPGSVISVHHSYSPDPSPYDWLRMLSPVPYIGPTEYASVGLKNLPYPLRFEPLRGERVGYLYVANCTIEDIAALLPERDSPYVAFHGCDLTRLPKEQRDKLRAVWDTVENRYIYSLGNV